MKYKKLDNLDDLRVGDEIKVPVSWLEGLRERRDVVKHDLKGKYFKSEIYLLLGYLDSIEYLIKKSND